MYEKFRSYLYKIGAFFVCMLCVNKKLKMLAIIGSIIVLIFLGFEFFICIMEMMIVFVVELL